MYQNGYLAVQLQMLMEMGKVRSLLDVQIIVFIALKMGLRFGKRTSGMYLLQLLE